jgi:hypothetical protein
LLLLNACNDVEVKTDSANMYFDVPAYFQAKSMELAEMNAKLMKSASKNGEQEHLELVNPDWNKEFSAFLAIDLNRRALINEYQVDSVQSEKGLEINYTTNNTALDVQYVSIWMENDSVKSIKIFRKNENLIFSNHQTLTYAPSNYKVEGNIQIFNFYHSNYLIQGNIVK